MGGVKVGTSSQKQVIKPLRLQAENKRPPIDPLLQLEQLVEYLSIKYDQCEKYCLRVFLKLLCQVIFFEMVKNMFCRFQQKLQMCERTM